MERRPRTDLAKLRLSQTERTMAAASRVATGGGAARLRDVDRRRDEMHSTAMTAPATT